MLVSCLCFLAIAAFSFLILAQESPAAPSDPTLKVWYSVNTTGKDALLDGTTNGFSAAIPANFAVAYGPGPATNVYAAYFSPQMTASIPLSSTNSFSSEALSIATWFQNTSTNSVKAHVLAEGTDSSTNSWTLSTDTNGLAHLTLSDSMGNLQDLKSVATNSLYDGGWHQITATLNTNSASLYVDDSAAETSVNWTGTNTVTKNSYDYLNRLLTTTSYSLGSEPAILVTNGYDEVSNKVTVQDGKLQTTTFGYDGLKRNTTIIDPATNTTTFAYDSLNKVQRVDALGQLTNYTYEKSPSPAHTRPKTMCAIMAMIMTAISKL